MALGLTRSIVVIRDWVMLVYTITFQEKPFVSAVVVHVISIVPSLTIESSIVIEVVNTKEMGDSVNGSKKCQVGGSYYPLIGTGASPMAGLNFSVILLMEGTSAQVHPFVSNSNVGMHAAVKIL
ncbi:hypothetical protein V6N13_080359 [Hibiscus sabdariffa]